jgi:hypothetical protein
VAYSVEIIDSLSAIGTAGKTACKMNQEDGGSKKAFAAEMLRRLQAFMADDERKLLIFNPAYFEVWRQDSKMYNNQASMASLTPTEITQIISDSCIQVVQAMGITNTARICLVFEEAHSLIPEWSSVAADGDRAATNGTARAILQGRKYGLGCVIVTQRTGKEFLSNYIGNQYASKLSSLKERQAVFYGRASSCENPVMIRLNNREDFIRTFRATE